VVPAQLGPGADNQAVANMNSEEMPQQYMFQEQGIQGTVAARSDLFATSVENPAAGTHVLGRLPKSGIISTSPASRGSKRGSAG
jgi:hypothetical protein